jgi:predicted lipoprotein with Yx(FWY)xxD motif
MRKRLTLAAAPVALALVAAGCGAGATPAAKSTSTRSGGAAAGAPALTVTTRHTTLGTILVNGQGQTLYLFEKDKGMQSSCTGACVSIWPPLKATGTPVAGAGLSAIKLATAKRSDGTSAITYAGHPLYTYVGDTKPGDTHGQGLNQFGAEWYVLAPNGRKVDNG